MNRFKRLLAAACAGMLTLCALPGMGSWAEDAAEECERYAELLKKNPPDIVCMGIGENGHIAFNDPHVAEFDDKKVVKIVELDDTCRTQPALTAKY